MSPKADRFAKRISSAALGPLTIRARRRLRAMVWISPCAREYRQAATAQGNTWGIAVRTAAPV